MARLSAWLVAALLFEVMTSATFLWYRDERGYVDQRGMPVRLPLRDWSELTVVPDHSPRDVDRSEAVRGAA